MQAIANGDRAALGLLYNRHAPRLLAVCRRILIDAAEADEVLVDVFCEVRARSGQFDATRGCPLTYLFMLARSRSIDRRRQWVTRRPAWSLDPYAVAAAPIAAAGPAELAEVVEMAGRVRTTLAALAIEQRTAIECAFYEGLSHREVAERLGQPVGTVKTRIRQGLITLRLVLGQDAASMP